jgi:hypothetical protein
MVSEGNHKQTGSKTLGRQVSEIVRSTQSVMDIMGENIANIVTSMNPTMDAIGEMAAKTVSVIYKLSELFKYHEIVPPQVFDMLVKLKVPLTTEEVKELQKLETEEEKKIYTIFTRKSKGNKIYNPKFYVTKEMFNAIGVVLSRNSSSIRVASSLVYFDKDTCALDVYGLVTYMKKDSDRYKLCKYMFGKKRGPKEWEVKELVEELSDGERVYDPDDKKSSHNWINGKIIELNKDVYDSLGVDELVSYERGRFVLNSANRL